MDHRLRSALAFSLVNILGILAAIWLSGCGPSGSASSPPAVPALGPTSAVPGGTITYAASATPSQVAAGAPYVARYLEHWCPPGRMQIDVEVLPDVVPHRFLISSRVVLSYAPDGTIEGTEWEISLEAQGLGDPAGWNGTWGAWGPIFPGSVQGWP